MAQHQIQNDHQSAHAPSGELGTPQVLSPMLPPPGSPLAQILEQASLGHYEKAINLCLKHGNRTLDVVNARGVCLLRTGRYDEAIVLFRNLVLQPNCTWTRKDRAAHYKTNFASALLLGGHPNGCLQILHEFGKEAPPTAAQLRSAIKQWEKTLPFWAWLNWKTGYIEPHNRPITIDFLPGDFGFPSATDVTNAVPWLSA